MGFRWEMHTSCVKGEQCLNTEGPRLNSDGLLSPSSGCQAAWRVGAGFQEGGGAAGGGGGEDGEEVQIQPPLLLAQLTSPGGMFLQRPSSEINGPWFKSDVG